MFLTLENQKLEVYACSRAFVKEWNCFSSKLQPGEKFEIFTQISRAALYIPSDLGYLNNNPVDILGEKLQRCFKLLAGIAR